MAAEIKLARTARVNSTGTHRRHIPIPGRNDTALSQIRDSGICKRQDPNSTGLQIHAMSLLQMLRARLEAL
jgi:hypothetical protein